MASNHNSRVTHKDQEMGTKLQTKIRGRNKLKRRIYLKTQTELGIVRVRLKEARRLEEPLGLQMMIQMMILVQKDQMLEEMVIDLAQIMNQIRRQQLRNLPAVLEKSLPQCLNGKSSQARSKEVPQQRLTNATS